MKLAVPAHRLHARATLGHLRALPARAPAVAGEFYPDDGAALASLIDSSLAGAQAALGARPLAIVSPHAGYAFCGRIIAEAWRQTWCQAFDLIVLLGAAHAPTGFDGISVWTQGAWRTPLGLAGVDVAAGRALIEADPADCVSDLLPHQYEHSIEIQVPFAQRLFPRVPILPVVVACRDAERCGRLGAAVAAVARERRTLIVASSDLSHYLPWAEAERIDRTTLQAVATLDPEALRRTIATHMAGRTPGLVTCACGEAAIRVAMTAARLLGAARGEVLAYANSAEVSYGDPHAVVGYGAVAFVPWPAQRGRHSSRLLKKAEHKAAGTRRRRVSEERGIS